MLVASTARRLAADDGDLWDSGKVGSDATLHVAYDGRPLGSRERCYWKVRVWDRNGRPSPWSKPATWSMGLLDAADWDARWIAFDDPLRPAASPPRHGFLTSLSPAPDIPKSVALDLGEEFEIDAVRLHPAAPRVTPTGAPGYTCVWEPEWPGYLFPVRFVIEAARRADFSDAVTVVDRSDADLPNPENGRHRAIASGRCAPATYASPLPGWPVGAGPISASRWPGSRFSRVHGTWRGGQR